MVKFNEKKDTNIKLLTCMIKLSAIDKFVARNGQEIVVIHGENKGETFSNFDSVWRKQGISLNTLNYGDELCIRFKVTTDRNGREWKNFTDVYTMKTVKNDEIKDDDDFGVDIGKIDLDEEPTPSWAEEL